MLSVIIRAYAGIAQLVEHLIRNEGVAGSSPVSGTTNKKPVFAGFFIFVFYQILSNVVFQVRGILHMFLVVFLLILLRVCYNYWRKRH